MWARTWEYGNHVTWCELIMTATLADTVRSTDDRGAKIPWQAHVSFAVPWIMRWLPVRDRCLASSVNASIPLRAAPLACISPPMPLYTEVRRHRPTSQWLSCLPDNRACIYHRITSGSGWWSALDWHLSDLSYIVTFYSNNSCYTQIREALRCQD